MNIPVKDEEQAPQHGAARNGPRGGTHSGDPHVLVDAHTALHLAGEENDENAGETHIWRGIG